MERKFKQYRISIGKPLIVTPQFFSPRPPEKDAQRWLDLEDFYHKDKDNSFVLESNLSGDCFSISFDCSRKSGTNAECSIDIFNLDDELTEYILDNSGNDLLVKLEAGYVGELNKVIEGTVSSAHDSWDRQNRTMSIVVEDAAVNIRDAYTVRKYGKNTPFPKIVEDLVTDLKVKKGVITALDKYPVTKVPVTYSGNTNDIIHMLAKKYKHVFTINDSHAYMTPINQRVKTVSTYLEAGSGLIGDATKKKRRKKAKADAKDDMLVVKCQLDANIYPDLSVYVKDNTISSAVKVEKVRLRGSYPKGTWECMIDGLLVEDEIV